MSKTTQGEITIFWEIKEDDWIAVAVDVPHGAKQMPLAFRRRIVTRLREILIPAKEKG